MSRSDEVALNAALSVPPHKRPARVVCVVLSSSSVPRVGKRAAVRRLHRAFLVREMAGMLDEAVEEYESDESEDEYEYENEEDKPLQYTSRDWEDRRQWRRQGRFVW